MALGSGVAELGATAGVWVFFGVGPDNGVFFASAPVLPGAVLVKGDPVADVGGFTDPVTAAGFWLDPAFAGLLALAGVGEAFANGVPGCVPPGVFGAFGSTLGTLGRRCDKMSAARMGSGPADAE